MKQSSIPKFGSENKRETQQVVNWLKHLNLNSPRQGLTTIEGNNYPDFYFEPEGMLIEVKEIRDFLDTQRSAQWGTTVHNIGNAIKEDKRYSQVKGCYSVRTPSAFKLSRGKVGKYATKIMDAVLSDKERIEIDDITFEIEQLNDNESAVYFVTHGPAGSFSASQTIYFNLAKSVAKAEKQLGNNKHWPKEKRVKKRVLLLVNMYRLMMREEDLVEALSYMSDDLASFQNIDEIWLQDEQEHMLILEKSFLPSLRMGVLNPNHPFHTYLFQLWFWALDKEARNKDALVDGLRSLLAGDKPASSVFSDSYKRGDMTRLASWLLEKDRVEDAEWIIDRFINDPDPADPPTSPTEDLDYDEKIRKGDDPTIITTVMGHLAWVVKELAAKSERHDISNLKKAFAYTRRVLDSRSNLYVAQQWLVPVMELANRRLILLEEDPAAYVELRSWILDPNNGLLIRYAQYQGTGKYLINIFSYFHELTTLETKLVLDSLLDINGVEHLLIYFAIYRPKHYLPELGEVSVMLAKIIPDIPKYKPEYAEELLKKLLMSKSEDKEIQEKRASAAWNLWKILKEDPEEFPKLVNWIEYLFRGGYYSRTGTSMGEIIKQWYGVEVPNIYNPAHDWLMRYLRIATEYAESQGREVWLDGPDELITKVAEHKPEDMAEIIDLLTRIWIAKGYIGELHAYFESYKYVSDPGLRADVKAYAQMMHQAFQELNPAVPDVVWED